MATASEYYGKVIEAHIVAGASKAVGSKCRCISALRFVALADIK